MSNSLFGVDATRLSDPQGQGANVVAPATANPLGGIVEGIANVASIFSSIKQEDKKDKDNAVLNEYTTKLNSLANAISSGQMDSKEASAKASQLYQDYSGSRAPHLAEELAKRRKAVFEGSTLGEAEQQAKMQRELKFEALRSYQASGGYVSPNATDMEINAIVKSEAVRRTEQEKWTRYRQEQEESRATGRYNTEVEKQQDERMANESLNTLASTQIPAFNASMEGLLKDIESGKMDYKTATTMQNAIHNSLSLRLQQVAGMAPQLAQSWKKILDDTNETYKRLLNPETRASVSEAELKELQNKQLLLVWTKSPKAQQSFVMNRFAPGTLETLAGVKGTASEISGIWANTPVGTDVVPSVVGDKENSKPVVSSIMTNMKNVYGMKDGDPRKTTAVEGMQNHVNNLLTDIYVAGSNEFKPLTTADLNDAASLISTPEFGRMVKENLVNPKAISAAQRVLAIQYNQPVLNKATEIISNVQGTLKGVNVVYQDGQIVLIGKTDSTRSGIQQDNSRYQGKEVAKAIDRVVKMNANLLGELDYKKYWEENKHLLLPTLFKAPEGDKGADTGVSTPKSGGTVTDALQREYDRLVSAGKPSWLSQEAYDEQVKIVKRELEASKGK